MMFYRVRIMDFKIGIRLKSDTAATRTTNTSIPRLNARWFYATDIPATKPYDSNYTQIERPKKFLPFTYHDSQRIESTFQNFKKAKDKNFRYVPVNEDQLFDCDLEKRLLKSAYWEGPTYEIRRGTWFIDSTPLPELLADQIEKAYSVYQPYKLLKKNEVNEDGKPHKLPSVKLKSEVDMYKTTLGLDWPFKEHEDLANESKEVHFKDDNTAVLLSDSQMFTKLIVDNIESSSPNMLGAYVVTRGYIEKQNTSNEREHKESKEEKDIKKEDGQKSSLKSKSRLAASDYFSRSNEKFQAFMEKDFSNDSMILENNGERDVDHLILCVHGIGQSLSSKYSAINFAHDCNNFRQLLKSEFKNNSKKYVPLAYGENINEDSKRNCKVQVLPIVWRYQVDFSWNRVYEDLGSDGKHRLPKFSELNIDAVTPIRTITADVILDILLYYEPRFKKQILQIVVKSANDLYQKYLKRHPNFKGKVSLCGHSLGSVIALDILSCQPDEIPNKEELDANIHLKFPVENYFGLGSPNGVFKFLKRQNVHPRTEGSFDNINVDAEDDPKSILDKAIIAPKVNNIYNVFYSADLVAYRLEPMIHPSLAKLKPKQIETPLGEGLTSQFKKISKVPTDFMTNQFFKQLVEKTGLEKNYEGLVQGEEQKVVLSDTAKELMLALNKNGRVDYVLPQGLFDINLINAVGSHTQYFSDPDVSNFVLGELWKKKGEIKDIYGNLVTKEELEERNKTL